MQGALPTRASPRMHVCSAVSHCGFVLTGTLPAIFLSLFLSCKFRNTLAGKRKSVMDDNAGDPGTLSWQEAWPEEGLCQILVAPGRPCSPSRVPLRIALSSSPETPCCLAFLPASPPLGLCFTRAMAESLCLVSRPLSMDLPSPAQLRA